MVSRIAIRTLDTCLCLLLPSLVCCRRLAAQSPPARTAIDSFRLALAADSDTTRVLEMLGTARARVDSAKKDPVLRTELGWALLRAGEVTDSNDLILAAADAFWAAGDREPHWPYPWYGLGMTKAELAVRRVKIRFPPHQPVGASWLEAAEMFFGRAGEADPTYVPAATALGQIALNDNFDTEILPALQQLHPALDSSQRDPDPFLVLGRLAFRADSYVTAHAGFRFYLSRGGDSATGLFEDARALYGLDRQED
ncbi:MAG: tetratricopeptide repeat protein, partial [Gemmatimonadales bacterium]